MTPPALIDANGVRLNLDAKVGGGGEGDVYGLSADSASVVKVYHKPPTDDTIAKLTAMVALATDSLRTVAAWPTGLVRDARSHRVAGFVMPRVRDGQSVQTLYNPAQRLRSFPRAGWAFQVRAAANLAAAFDEVHNSGCVVGDVNQSNAFVSPAALVTLIDCDSFQVRANNRHYLCDVGVPHYTPPELQGQPLRGVARTVNHDRFGLAVLIYQLLFVGRHPYMGLYSGPDDPSFDRLIAEYRFAQGPDASTWQMAPPPHVPTFADIPPALGTLFRRAFERRNSDARPTAGEWHAELGHLGQSIVTCPADSGHTYWRGADRCVWCRLARGGVEYYYGVAGGVGGFAVDEAALCEMLRRLDTVGREGFAYDRGQFTPRHLPHGRPLPHAVANHLHARSLVGGAAALCGVASPLLCVNLTVGAIAILGAIVLGVWYVAVLNTSPWYRERATRRETLDVVRGELLKLEAEWTGVVARYERDQSRLTGSVETSVGRCRGLAEECARELARLRDSAEAAGRMRHLRLHPIADATIAQVGAGRRQALAEAGILTAADVTADAVMRVAGFGPAITASVVAWRDGVSATYRFDPAAAVNPSEQAATVSKYRARQQQLVAEVSGHLTALEALAPAVRERLRSLHQPLRQAVEEYERAHADLRVMSR